MASYLELNQLEVGKIYRCQLYDSIEEVFLEYKGEGSFEDWECTYTVYGDVRYVFEEVI